MHTVHLLCMPSIQNFTFALTFSLLLSFLTCTFSPFSTFSLSLSQFHFHLVIFNFLLPFSPFWNHTLIFSLPPYPVNQSHFHFLFTMFIIKYLLYPVNQSHVHFLFTMFIIKYLLYTVNQSHFLFSMFIIQFPLALSC